MPPKADSHIRPAPQTEPNASGKWVILGILAVGFTAAGASWWFRYNATHHAATFWGRNAWLIRDADRVELLELHAAPKDTPPQKNPLSVNGGTFLVRARQDISQAH